MQVSTVANIGKVVFALAVVGILIYIAVKKSEVNLGNWSIDGTDDKMLKITSPNKNVVFGIDQDNEGIRVQNYLVKGDQYALQFFDPGLTSMATMKKNEMTIGGVAIIDNTANDIKDDQGVVLVDVRNNKPMAVINDQILRWPVYGMYLKCGKDGDRTNFQVYSSQHGVLLKEPKSLSSNAYYNII
jgi:hypothetical protein